MNSLRWIAAAATLSLSLPVFAVTTSSYDFNNPATASTIQIKDGTGVMLNGANTTINSYDGFQNGQYFGNQVTYAGSNGGSVVVTAWASTGGAGNNTAPTGTNSGVSSTSTKNGTLQNAVVTQYGVSNGGSGPYSGSGNALAKTSRNTNINAEFGKNSTSSTTCASATSCETLSNGTANHAVDNNGAYETLLFSFSSSVTLSSITLGYPGVGAGNNGTSDLTYLYCTAQGTSGGNCGATYFAGKTYSTLVSSGNWAYGNLYNLSSSNDTASTGLNVKSQYWMVGAYIADLPAPQGAGDGVADYVKIRAITTCSSTVCAVPEPSSVALFGLAGTALWIGRRRRTLRVVA